MDSDMSDLDVTHRDIYDKINSIENDLIIVKEQVKQMQTSTKDLLVAFNAAHGAFQVLEWIAKITKPLIVVVGFIGTVYMSFKGIKG